jgi:hypothetical protein
MSPNAVRHAVRPENRTRRVAVAIAVEAVGQPRDRCSLQNAPPAAKILKYLLNHVVIDRSTVQIVTEKQTRQKDIN